MRAALELLADLPGRRVAVLGEMLELGDAHDDGHRDVGRATASVADLLVVVGAGAPGIVEARARRGSIQPVLPVSDRAAAVDGAAPAAPAWRRGAGQGLARRGPRDLVDALAAELGAAEPATQGADPPMTLDLIQGLLLVFALVVILMPAYIRLLRYTGFGKRIRATDPRATWSRRACRRWAASS